MYWGQIVVATVGALWTVYYVTGRGVALVPAMLVGVCVYVGIRWVIAWFYRVRYWHRRGTGGVYRERCPNCHAARHRLSGDWILQCHTCGWKPGWPLVRWFTRSVPVIQLRRTVIGPKLLVVIVAVALLASGTVAGMGVGDITASPAGGAAPSDDGTGSSAGAVATPTVAAERDSPTPTSERLDRSRLERLIHQFINAERRARGLSTLAFDDDLREIARYHSRDMATEGYFAHKAPDGETMADRYEEFGYDCRVNTGGNRYATGAENIAYEHRYTTRSEPGGYTPFDGNETALAKSFVTGWMNSEGHRENILKPHWENEGIGVYIVQTDSNMTVYATQNFC